jgi:hypothetical protein
MIMSIDEMKSARVFQKIGHGANGTIFENGLLTMAHPDVAPLLDAWNEVASDYDMTLINNTIEASLKRQEKAAEDADKAKQARKEGKPPKSTKGKGKPVTEVASPEGGESEVEDSV